MKPIEQANEFEKQLDAAIEKGSVWQDNHQFRMEPYKEITHADSFKAGANLLKPLLLLAMKQRDHHCDLESQDWIEQDNKELLQMIGDI